MNRKFGIAISSSIVFAFVFQSLFAYTCPDYFFSTDLAKGNTNADVHVIQEILNLDKRTVVSFSGPGSKGSETNYFGIATREALKRFQALFIEYVGVANGKFGPKTRTSMNAVCKGPFFTNGTGGVYDTGTTTAVLKDKIAPTIAIAAPLSTDIQTPFRAYVGGNEPIKPPTLDGLIISNATAGDLRKISSTTYTFLVTPNADAQEPILLQFEAESVMDLAGNKNENASNEWLVSLTGTSTSATSSNPYVLPDIELPIVGPVTGDCSTVTSVDINDYTNPCYGKAPMTNSNQASADAGGGGGGGGGGGAEQIMQMLQGLLKGLGGGGGGGGGQEAGGKTAGPDGGKCECPGPAFGQPTELLIPKKGYGGRALATPCPLAGDYVGKTFPGPGICGQKYIKGQCINPTFDSTGMGPVAATVGACGPTWATSAFGGR